MPCEGYQWKFDAIMLSLYKGQRYIRNVSKYRLWSRSMTPCPKKTLYIYSCILCVCARVYRKPPSIWNLSAGKLIVSLMYQVELRLNILSEISLYRRIDWRFNAGIEVSLSSLNERIVSMIIYVIGILIST